MVLDGGTTHTRMRLIHRDRELIGEKKLSLGIRDVAIEGTKKRFINELEKEMKMFLEKNDLSASDVSAVVSSGMLTSNLGIYEVPHLIAPVTKEALVKGAVITKWEEFGDVPFMWIPGVRTEGEALDEKDVMRGEEVETLGLTEQRPLDGTGLMILPGSHTKYVGVKEGTINYSYTTLGGEMMRAVQQETILANSIQETLIEEVDQSYLEAGFRAARDVGLLRSLFHIRLLHLEGQATANQRANYLAGAVVSEDVRVIEGMKEVDWIMVGGSNPLRSAFTYLLHQVVPEGIEILEADESESERATLEGALTIIEEWNKQEASQ